MDDVVVGAHLGALELVRVGLQEVAPQQRRVADALDRARRHRLGEVDDEVAVEDGLGLLLGLHVVIHHVEAVVVGELGVDAVAGEPAAEAVAAVALDGHRLDGLDAAHQRAGLVADAHEAAAAVDLEGGLLGVARDARRTARGRRENDAGRVVGIRSRSGSYVMLTHTPWSRSRTPSCRGTTSPPLAGSGSRPSFLRAPCLGSPSLPVSRNIW